jgi:hypothetical protein
MPTSPGSAVPAVVAAGLLVCVSLLVVVDSSVVVVLLVSVGSLVVVGSSVGVGLLVSVGSLVVVGSSVGVGLLVAVVGEVEGAMEGAVGNVVGSENWPGVVAKTTPLERRGVESDLAVLPRGWSQAGDAVVASESWNVG